VIWEMCFKPVLGHSKPWDGHFMKAPVKVNIIYHFPDIIGHWWPFPDTPCLSNIPRLPHLLRLSRKRIGNRNYKNSHKLAMKD